MAYFSWGPVDRRDQSSDTVPRSRYNAVLKDLSETEEKLRQTQIAAAAEINRMATEIPQYFRVERKRCALEAMKYAGKGYSDQWQACARSIAHDIENPST